MAHVVHRQRLEIELSRSAEDAYRAQVELADLCRDDLPQALSPVFDEATGDGRHLRIGRLEIDLALQDSPDVRGRLLEQIREAVRKALHDARVEAGTAETALVGEVLDAQTAEHLLFEHLLETGTLPWWAPSVAPGELTRRLRALVAAGGIERVLGRGDVRRRVHRLFAAFREAAPEVATRLAGRAGVKVELAEAVAAGPPGVASSTWELTLAEELTLALVGQFPMSDGNVRPVKLAAARARARLLIPEAEPRPAAAPDAGAAMSPLSSQPVIASAPGEAVPTKPASWQPIAAEPSTPPAAQPASSGDRPAAPEPLKPAAGQPLQPRAGVAAGLPAIWQEQPLALPEPRRAPVPDGESLLVDDGGVVLLHPFLPTFLGAVGLVEGGAFKGDAARGRAVCLLHWLATGESVEEEHPLVLAKILCGVPIEAVVEPIGEPTPAEREEAEALLVHAASLWTALKSRSPEALRRGFLLRPGLISTEPTGWLLRLEARGWDVLLDRLPWGISHVKLKWMSGMLQVLR